MPASIGYTPTSGPLDPISRCPALLHRACQKTSRPNRSASGNTLPLQCRLLTHHPSYVSPRFLALSPAKMRLSVTLGGAFESVFTKRYRACFIAALDGIKSVAVVLILSGIFAFSTRSGAVLSV